MFGAVLMAVFSGAMASLERWLRWSTLARLSRAMSIE